MAVSCGPLVLTATWVLLSLNAVGVYCERHTVGVLVLVDYGLWNIHRQSPDVNNDAEATAKIEYYFVHLFKTSSFPDHGALVILVSEVNRHFDTLSNIDMDVVLQDLRISKSPSTSLWSEAHRVPDDTWDLVDAPAALNSLADMLEDDPTAYSQYDHVMGVTGYDAFRPLENGEIKKQKTGGALLDGMCSTSNKVSIVEDRQDFMSAIVISHELGHNLGARHDGDDNPCLASGKFILAPVVETSLDSEPGERPYTTFSSCTEDYIQDFIIGLGTGSCLLDVPESFLSPAQTSVLLSTLPGQRYNLQQQCEIALGEGAFFCGRADDMNSVCGFLLCGQGNDCYRLPRSRTFDGTSCGNRQWCIDEVCVPAPEAPMLNEVCPFGDYRLTEECLRPDVSTRCYDETMRSLCCETCARLRDPTKPGCEYGDRLTQCTAAIRDQPRLCYVKNNAKTCCASCQAMATRFNYMPEVLSCQYGDKDRSGMCTPRHCATSQSTCCATCYDAGYVSSRGGTIPTCTKSWGLVLCMGTFFFLNRH